MRRYKVWLLLLAVCLLSSCGHGLRITPCGADVQDNEWVCQAPAGFLHHPAPTDVAFSASAGMVAYSAYDAQALLDYCAARKIPSTQAPMFDVCVSHPEKQGLTCRLESCSLIPAGGGIVCTVTDGGVFIPYSQMQGYLGLSPIDNQSLWEFCDVSEKTP